MLPINTVIDQLNKFKNDKLTKTDAEYLIGKLGQIDTLSDNDIDALSTKLNNWLKEERLKSVSYDGLTFTDVIYNSLLALAAVKPINKIDPISQEEFTTNKFPLSDAKLSVDDKDSIKRRIVTSSRHQFDMVSLAQWIRSKGEMINPLTGTVFNDRDIQTIKKLATDLTISLAAEHKADEPHPALLAGAINQLNNEFGAQNAAPIGARVRFFRPIPASLRPLSEAKLLDTEIYASLSDSEADRLNALQSLILATKISVNGVLALTQQQYLNLNSNRIKKLILEDKITVNQVKNLSEEPLQKLAYTQALISASILTIDDAFALTIQQALRLHAVNINKLILEGKITINQAKDLSEEKSEKISHAQALISMGYMSVNDALALTEVQALALNETRVVELIQEGTITLDQAKNFTEDQIDSISLGNEEQVLNQLNQHNRFNPRSSSNNSI